jgi:hypothetical protein
MLAAIASWQPGAQMWVNTNPGAHQDLAQRYLAGLGEI